MDNKQELEMIYNVNSFQPKSYSPTMKMKKHQLKCVKYVNNKQIKSTKDSGYIHLIHWTITGYKDRDTVTFASPVAFLYTESHHVDITRNIWEVYSSQIWSNKHVIQTHYRLAWPLSLTLRSESLPILIISAKVIGMMDGKEYMEIWVVIDLKMTQHDSCGCIMR